MDKGDRVWGGNWREKLASRLHALGFESVTDFIAKLPAVPYIQVAECLGDDIASFQLEWMHFEEAKQRDRLRYAAMDSLARDLRYHLPTGWRYGTKDDFDTAGAYADWIVRLEQQQADVKPKAKAVWAALEELAPPVGWVPSGSDDPFILNAFTIGWPETTPPAT